MIGLGKISKAILAGALGAWAFGTPVAAGPQADVVSIGGSVTEIVAALGQQHRLKARDTTSTYPPQVTQLPDVGYMRALSPEGVLSVAPALILADEGAGPPETVDLLRSSGVAFVTVPEALNGEAILQKIAIIGQALGAETQAARLMDQVQSDLAAARHATLRSDADKKRVLFILSTQGGKINVSGTGTAADAIINMAGGVNAASGFAGYKQITAEAIGLAAPDVILMMDRGGDHDAGDQALFSMPALQLTPAAQAGAVVRMDGLLMLGFGPRTAQAVEHLNRALYGPKG